MGLHFRSKGKTFDVNNKSMVRVEDYDRITEVII